MPPMAGATTVMSTAAIFAGDVKLAFDRKAPHSITAARTSNPMPIVLRLTIHLIRLGTLYEM